MNILSDEIGPSTSVDPDLDWSQIRETIFMLNLAIAQIVSSMTEGDESVDDLSNNFIKMAGDVKEIQLHASMIEDSPIVNNNSKQEILDKCDCIEKSVEASIVRYQFYDRLRQRLERVSESLTNLADLIGDSSKIFNPEEWKKLHESVRSGYATREEREMLELLFKGASVQDAIKTVIQQCSEEQDSVELF